MGIPPLFCAGIWVKRNLVPICIFDIYRIVACPENDVGELCVVPGPLEQELCSIFLPELQDQFNSIFSIAQPYTHNSPNSENPYSRNSNSELSIR